ncbi:MAG: 50S ribosomal protein L28 [Spirochaetaceae bacterium]|nr:MAG: 50S ribosomal protein L28 [Spirochaetaceae bacterium]
MSIIDCAAYASPENRKEFPVSRKCNITGKKPLAGNNVSHAHNKTRRVQRPNIQKQRIFVPELGRMVRIKLSTSALRTVNKLGLLPYLKKLGLTLKDVT